MGERGLQVKSDINKEGWETSDFPLVCETCLGENPYVRMTKEPHGKTCKICDRPFTIFRWRPGSKARFKKTEVCQTCAKMKNVCQVCVLDLTYGLPVQVRDSLLGDSASTALTVPQSDTNKQYFAQQHDRMVAEGYGESYGKAAINEKLLRLARSQPYYKRNLPHKCSFYAKGECTRGDRCPFLHEMPKSRDDPLANQNIKDRFYGQDDPVAEKLMRRQEALAVLNPPEDQTITSLWLGGVEPDIDESDIRDQLYSFGELAGVRMVPKQRGAFVEYTTREAAEQAAKTLHNNLMIKGYKIRLSWAFRPAGPPPGVEGGEAGASSGHGPQQPPPAAPLPPPGLAPGQPVPLPPPQILNFIPSTNPAPSNWTPGMIPPPPRGPPPPQWAHYAPPRGPPPPPSVPYYPSMDPQRMGARPPQA